MKVKCVPGEVILKTSLPVNSKANALSLQGEEVACHPQPKGTGRLGCLALLVPPWSSIGLRHHTTGFV